MPELRFDHTSADWVVFAPLRKLRPNAGSNRTRNQPEAPKQSPESCPFCPGNERLTPNEIFAIRDGSQSDGKWRVRVFPNKFPALRIEEDDTRHDDGPMFHYMGGCGAHEVIVESPEHFSFLGQQPVEQIELVWRALLRRYQDLMQDHRFQSLVIFKNHGIGAGTSLAHPHWQLIATPVVPRMLRLKCNEAAEHFDRTGKCMYSEMLDEELAAKSRIVSTNAEFVALIPYAAHLPFETWILPRRQHATIGDFQPEQLRPLAEILKSVLLSIYVGLDSPDFNLTVDMAPRNEESCEYFHWHIRILPRLTTPAGFEMGSGMSINTIYPEEAAAFLRDGATT